MNLSKIVINLFLLFFCVSLAAQTKQNTNESKHQKKISGTVVDQNGESVIGASVLVKGSTIGTITDIDGKYSIAASSEDKLVFSYVGFDSQEIPVKKNTIINVTLKSTTKDLDEVVVIGYGSVKKSNLTTSVSKISSESLESRPLTTISEAFSGQLAGVQTQVSSGVPGEDLQITVRGASSLNSTTPPLYVIDGIITESLNDVNPSDIESIQVLKDAAATSIYGARGSNGVVLIETKMAKGGKPVVTFDAYYGLQKADRLPEVMSPKEWLAYNIYCLNANYLNANGLNSMMTPNKNRPTNYQIPESWLLNPNSDTPDWRLNPNINQTNWIDEILRTAPVQSYQLSASGKSDMGSIYMSGGYMEQVGIVKNTDYHRINFRLNGTLNITKKLRLGVNLAPSVAKQRRGESEGKDKVILTALQYPCLIGIDENTRDFGYNADYPNYVNPYERLMQVTDNKGDNRLNASAWFQYDIIKGLSFKSIYNNNIRSTVYEYFIPANVVAPNATGGQVSSGNSYSEVYNNWGWQNVLSYDLNVKKHTINIMLGQSLDNTNTYRATVAATGWPLENVYTLNLATTPTTASTERYTVRTSSFFGRVSYDYADKYLFTASVRRDGSSRFGANNRWGTFPSFSAGWKISEENFMKNLDFLNLFKIRASWGQAGNDRVGYYDYLSTFDVSNTVYGGQSQAAMYPANYANADLKWENTTSVDLGLDLSFLKNRIQFNFDYYRNTTKSLLYDLQIPSTTGFTTTKTNVGKIRNTGWEIDLNTTNISTKDFKWSSTINLSANRNKVLDLGGNDNIITPAWNAYFITQVGGPISQFYLYRTDGLLTEGDFAVGPDGSYDRSQPLVPIMASQIPGNLKFVDTNKDGQITDEDMVPYGDNMPDLLWGFTNRFSYKGFELSIFLQGQFGGDVYYLASRNINFGRRFNNCLVGWLNSYKQTYRGGDPIPYELGVDMSWDGKTPLSYGLGANGVNENTTTDQRIYDATFLKIKNITLSYNLPKNLLQKAKIRAMKFYISMENVHTFTHYVGNPEVNSYSSSNPVLRGVDYSTYPLARKYSLGVNVTF